MATADSSKLIDPPKMSQRERYHHGDLRNRLVQTVTQLVEKHGAEGFSIAQAAKAAGVSSAAPYKHFKDKPEILRAVAFEGMHRLRNDMDAGSAQYEAGSLEAITALGVAYITFAKREPGVFRLMFGLTDGHEQTENLLAMGRSTYEVVINQVAQHLDVPPTSAEAEQRAYMLWIMVHGHSFLTIDEKAKTANQQIDDWAMLMDAGRRLLSF